MPSSHPRGRLLTTITVLDRGHCMKTFHSGALVALGLFAWLSIGAQAAERPAETDSLGRVVRDANGTRHNFPQRADGRATKLVVPATPAAKAGDAPPTARKSGVARLNAAAAALATSYSETWRFNTWSYGIGMGGFWPVDIDADGDKEIVYGVANAQWAIADYVPATH